MDAQQIKDKITALGIPVTFEDNKDILQILVDAAHLKPLAQELHSNPNFDFDYLFSLTAVDYPDHFMVVYHLESVEKRITLSLKAKITDKVNPSIETVSDIWAAADMQEREAYDFFGINFDNHPDLRRIFLADGFEGFPFRKDYKDEVNIVDL